MTEANLYKELGMLENDNVLFVGKADLEAGYVGQTAIKTQNVIIKISYFFGLFL